MTRPCCRCGKPVTKSPSRFRKTVHCGPCYWGNTGKGRSRNPAYKSWLSMKDRCLNPNSDSWDNYGGRGITISPEIAASFREFLQVVGPRPSMKHTLGRENNNGNYERGNMRWETIEQQNNNRRSNIFIEFNGKRQTLQQWAKEIGISFHAMRDRYNSGRPLSEVVKPKSSKIKITGPSRPITFNGVTRSMKGWARELDISVQALKCRLFKHHWPLEKALATTNTQRYQ